MSQLRRSGRHRPRSMVGATNRVDVAMESTKRTSKTMRDPSPPRGSSAATFARSLPGLNASFNTSLKLPDAAIPQKEKANRYKGDGAVNHNQLQRDETSRLSTMRRSRKTSAGAKTNVLYEDNDAGNYAVYQTRKTAPEESRKPDPRPQEEHTVKTERIERNLKCGGCGTAVNRTKSEDLKLNQTMKQNFSELSSGVNVPTRRGLTKYPDTTHVTVPVHSSGAYINDADRLKTMHLKSERDMVSRVVSEQQERSRRLQRGALKHQQEERVVKAYVQEQGAFEEREQRRIAGVARQQMRYYEAVRSGGNPGWNPNTGSGSGVEATEATGAPVT